MSTSGGVQWRNSCPTCGSEVAWEHRIDRVGYTLRHRSHGGCYMEGAQYDVNGRIIETIAQGVTDTAYEMLQENLRHQNNGPAYIDAGGGVYTVNPDNFRWETVTLNPTTEMAQQTARTESNAERLHRMGQKIVDGKIVSIMEGNDRAERTHPQGGAVQQVPRPIITDTGF